MLHLHFQRRDKFFRFSCQKIRHLRNKIPVFRLSLLSRARGIALPHIIINTWAGKRFFLRKQLIAVPYMYGLTNKLHDLSHLLNGSIGTIIFGMFIFLRTSNKQPRIIFFYRKTNIGIALVIF